MFFLLPASRFSRCTEFGTRSLIFYRYSLRLCAVCAVSSLNKATGHAVLRLLSCVRIPHSECICSFPEHQMDAPNKQNHLKIINHQRLSAWQRK